MDDRGRDGWLWAALALGLGLRLIWIDQPLIDQQAWRQTDTAAIARNYCEEGYDLFYPRVDWRGTTPGYAETEFPLYPFVVACFYRLVGGAREWVGRLFSALLSTATGALVYALAWRLYQRRWMARLAALFFLVSPLSVFYGRAFMPEPAMLLLSAATLLGFEDWLARGGRLRLALAILWAALCFLVKIPTLYLGFPLVALAWARWGWDFFRRPVLWLYLFLVLLPPALWYWHAHLLFEQTGLTFGIWNRYGYDKWANSLSLDPDYYLLMIQRLGRDVFTPLVGLLVVLGLTYRQGDRREWMLFAWIGGLLLYLILVPEGNRTLPYYQLPFVLPGALLAAKVLGPLLEKGEEKGPAWQRWLRQRRCCQRVGLVLAVLLAALACGVWAAIPYYRPPNNLYNYYQSCRYVGQILDRQLPSKALLVIGDLDENAGAPFRAQSPTLLYYCHRKGWQITPEEFAGERLDSLAALGADYFLVAGGFVRDQPGFWRELVRRGVTFPSAYPRFWTDERQFDQVRRAHGGLDRHFVLTRLRSSG